MGGSQSRAAISEISQQINDIAVSTVNDCLTSSDQSQSLTVNNSGLRLWGSYTMDQQSEVTSQCFSDVNRQMNLQNAIINAIAQKSTADGVAILSAFGASTAEASANLSNIIKNNITMSNIQRSYNLIKQKQSATFNNSGIIGYEQVALTQGDKLFAAATLTEVDRTGIFNMIENKIDQDASAKTSNPLDFISDLFSNIAMVIALVIVVIIVAVAGGLYLMMGGGRAVANAVTASPTPTPSPSPTQ